MGIQASHYAEYDLGSKRTGLGESRPQDHADAFDLSTTSTSPYLNPDIEEARP